MGWMSRTALSSVAATLLLSAAAPFGPAVAQPAGGGRSPALCGPGDVREPGVQGDVPKGATANYHCGVRPVSQLPLVGNVQGYETCVYVRQRGGQVHVVDVSNPRKPVQLKSIPVKWGSETMRVVATEERAILVSGSSVYDIKDCRNPVLAGEIKWPPLSIGVSPPLGGGGGTGILPHDLRINHKGTKVYGSMGLWEADISNLKDPNSWKVTDYRCDLAAQTPGPWQEVHRAAIKAGVSLCADQANPNGANYRLGGSGVQTSLLWPTLSHGIAVKGDDSLIYLGDQAGGLSGRLAGGPNLRIVRIENGSARIVGTAPGPGHSMDWVRANGRDYVLHANEFGTQELMGRSERGDTCKAYPRPTGLGWGFEVIVSDVTDPAQPRNVSMLRIAINDAEHCETRKASGRDPFVAYHLIDNPSSPRFAAVNFGSAGLRIFDIRNPEKPVEVAYFNHGAPVHGGIGHWDAKRRLLYVAGQDGLKVLEFQPQVRRMLGL